jgi:hypothetical protein
MKSENNSTDLLHELSDEDQAHIRMVFDEDMVPKLTKLDARLGTLNCEFAGEQFKNWSIQFRSKGSYFEIVEFAYDEEGEDLSLDL